jgi:amino acid transporter
MKKLIPVILGLTLLPLMVFGQQPNVAPNVELIDALNKIINLIFWILLIVSVIFLIIGGLQFVTAAGEAEKIEQARRLILYAIIGVVVAILARGIVWFIVSQIK